MRFLDGDRVRVSRVRVTEPSQSREIFGCWISVSVDGNQLGIWEDPDTRPSLVVSLENVEIDWTGRESRMMPMPASPA